MDKTKNNYRNDPSSPVKVPLKLGAGVVCDLISTAGHPVSVCYRWRCKIGIFIQLHLFDEGFLQAANYWVCWTHLLSCWPGQLSFIYYLPSEECGAMTKWPAVQPPLLQISGLPPGHTDQILTIFLNNWRDVRDVRQPTQYRAWLPDKRRFITL